MRKEDSVTSAEDDSNMKNQQKKRGRPKKNISEEVNAEKKEKAPGLNHTEKVDAKESTSHEREVGAEEATATSPVRIKRHRRKGIPRRAAV